MKKTLDRFKNRVFSVLELDLFSENFVNFVIVHLGFLVATNLLNTFINTFFYRLTGNWNMVLLFNLLVFGLTPIGMCFAVFFIKRKTFVASFQVGFVFYILDYILFFILLCSQKLFLVPFVAILTAFGNGFYWGSYALSLTLYIGNDRRNQAISLIGICSGATAVFMPLLSGFVISGFKGFIGYGIMMTFSTLVFLASLIFSKKLKKIEEKSKKTLFFRALKNSILDKSWRFNSLCEFFKGSREGLFSFFPSILLFEIIKNERIVSINVIAMGLLTIAANMIYRKLNCGKWLNKNKMMRYSIHVLIFCALWFLCFPGIFSVVVLGLVNAFLQIFLLNPPLRTTYMLADSSRNTNEMSSENFAIKNAFASFGKVIGISLVLLISFGEHSIQISILILTLLQYPMYMFCIKTESLINERNLDE